MRMAHVSADHTAGLPSNRLDLSWGWLVLVLALAWGVKWTRLLYFLSTASCKMTKGAVGP